MVQKKGKRETATKNVRIYPSTLLAAQKLSEESGKTLARVFHEKLTHGKNS